MDLSIAESKSSTGSQPAGASVADLATEKALDGIRLKGGAGQGMEGCWSEQVTELLEQVMAQPVLLENLSVSCVTSQSGRS